MKSRLPQREISGRDDELLDLLEKIKDLPNEIYWFESFSRSALTKSWPVEKMKDLGEKASECAKEYVEFYKRQLEDGIDMRQLYLNNGVALKEFAMPQSPGMEVFALFEIPNIVSVRTDLMANCDEYVANSGIGDVLGEFSCKDTILAHELFHYIETKNQNTIFTYKYTEPTGLFKRQTLFPPLGEIAAMSFARELLDLEWNPFILDCVMMSMNNVSAAKAIGNRLYANYTRLFGEEG